MTWRKPEDHATETGETKRLLRGLARRMAVTLAGAKARWQLRGQRGGQGGDEVVEVEAFTSIGFYSTPAPGANAEAITVAIGGAKTHAIVATRDEGMRQKSAGNLGAGETAMFNDKAIVHAKNDGTVEVRGVPSVQPPEKMIKGETYRAAEDELINAFFVFATVMTAYTQTVAALPGVFALTAPAAAAVLAGLNGALVPALAAFEAASASYLARVGKVE